MKRFKMAAVSPETHRMARVVAARDGKRLYETYQEAIEELARKTRKEMGEVGDREFRFF